MGSGGRRPTEPKQDDSIHMPAHKVAVAWVTSALAKNGGEVNPREAYRRLLLELPTIGSLEIC